MTELGNTTSKGLTTHIAGSAVKSFVIRASSTIVNFAIATFLARSLGPNNYGQYVVVVTIIAFLTNFATLGLPKVIVRFYAEYFNKNKEGLIKGLIVFACIAVLLVCLLISSMLYNYSDLLLSIFGIKSKLLLLGALPIVVLSSLTLIIEAILLGDKRVAKSQVSSTLVKSTSFSVALFLSFSFVYPAGRSPEMALALNALASSVAFLCAVGLFSRYIATRMKSCFYDYDIGNWCMASAPLLFYSIMALINQQADILMLASLSNDNEIARYHVATRGSELVTFLLVCVNVALAPQIAELISKELFVQLEEVMQRFAKMLFLLSILPSLALIIYGKYFIILIFGQDYVDSYDPLVVLVVSQLLNVGIGSVGLLLIMSGHGKAAALGMLLAALINMFVNYFAIPVYGALGAAYATSASLVVWNIGLWIYAIVNVNVNPSIIPFRCSSSH